MKTFFRDTGRLATALGKPTLVLFILYGLLLTLVPLLPFWLDEWLLLENLKFKPAAELWGPLDRTQQFPRVYLQLIKSLGAALDYSYTSLRLPAFLAHCFGLALLWRLAARIFPGDRTSRWLWIMIYVSFNTSIHYFVQLKQYTMEMALSLLAIWQLLRLLAPDRLTSRTTLLLSVSLLLAPFFSYTYPIALAPVYMIVSLRALRERRIPEGRVLLVLGAGILAIAAAYWFDVRQVLADPGMQDFWQDLLMKPFHLGRFFRNIWMMFCTLGSGDLFGNIFGALGLAGFCHATWCAAQSRMDPGHRPLRLYSCLLVWTAIALFIAGKLPLGTFRLNSFLVPAMAYLIVDLLQDMARARQLRPAARGLALVLFLAATGSVYSTMAELAGETDRRKLAIYNATAAALQAAAKERLPVFVSPAIAFPFEDRWEGDWILKVQPDYHDRDRLPVYRARTGASVQELKAGCPEQRGPVIYLDGPVWKRLDLE